MNIIRRTSFLVVALFCFSFSAHADDYKVQYISGMPNTEATQQEGVLQVESDAITFWDGKPGKSNQIFTFPTKAVTDFSSGDKAKNHPGATVAVAVAVSPIGLAVKRFRKKHNSDLVIIDFDDAQTKRNAAPAFMVRDDIIPKLKRGLESKTGKSF